MTHMGSKPWWCIAICASFCVTFIINARKRNELYLNIYIFIESQLCYEKDHIHSLALSLRKYYSLYTFPGILVQLIPYMVRNTFPKHWTLQAFIHNVLPIIVNINIFDLYTSIYIVQQPPYILDRLSYLFVEKTLNVHKTVYYISGLYVKWKLSSLSLV